jgi:hypothetical protein
MGSAQHNAQRHALPNKPQSSSVTTFLRDKSMSVCTENLIRRQILLDMIYNGAFEDDIA